MSAAPAGVDSPAFMFPLVYRRAIDAVRREWAARPKVLGLISPAGYGGGHVRPDGGPATAGGALHLARTG